jgi:hypothetical protein
MHAALLFGQRDPRWIPAVAKLAGGVVDREPEVIAQLGTGNAFRLVFVIAGLPDPREIGLRERGRRHRQRQRTKGDGQIKPSCH